MSDEKTEEPRFCVVEWSEAPAAMGTFAISDGHLYTWCGRTAARGEHVFSSTDAAVRHVQVVDPGDPCKRCTVKIIETLFGGPVPAFVEERYEAKYHKMADRCIAAEKALAEERERWAEAIKVELAQWRPEERAGAEYVRIAIRGVLRRLGIAP